MRERGVSGILLLAVLIMVAALVRLTVGRIPGADGSWAIVMGWPSEELRPFRFGALVSALAAGWSLGLAGLLLQVLLRNPLASPWVLGLSSGAGLGVMVALALSALAGISISGGAGLVLPAVLGALSALAVTWWLGRVNGLIDPLRLLLVGVVVASLAGALSMALQDIVPHGLRVDFLDWMMGRIPEAPGGGVVWSTIIIALLVGGVAWRSADLIDLACLGEDEARSSGLRLGRVRTGLFLGAGALTATAVALVGPIGFVGLLAPHLARLMVGPGHRLLVPGTCLAGMAMLLSAETVRQFIDLGGGRLHVGVLTAMLGGPFFLWLLCRGGGWTR